jgi:hypothetical protein
VRGSRKDAASYSAPLFSSDARRLDYPNHTLTSYFGKSWDSKSAEVVGHSRKLFRELIREFESRGWEWSSVLAESGEWAISTMDLVPVRELVEVTRDLTNDVAQSSPKFLDETELKIHRYGEMTFRLNPYVPKELIEAGWTF